MSIKTFRLWQRIIAAIIAMVIAVSVVYGNAIVPIPTVIAGMLIIMVLKRRVKDIIEDERVYAIADKASRLTLQIVAIIMAVMGGTLLAMSRGGSPALAQIGFTLCYATCGLLVIYYVAYIYYRRKFGGE